MGTLGRERLRIRTTAVGAGAVWFVFAMFAGKTHPGFGTQGADLALTLGVVGSAGCLVLAIRMSDRGSSYAMPLYVLGTGAGILAYALAPSRPASVVLFAFCGFAASRSFRLALPILVIAILGIAGVVLAQDRPLDGLWTTVGLLGLFAAARARVTRDAARVTEHRNLVLAERAHIAREIHDILAHSLSAQLVHLEGARLLIAGDRTDEALERVEWARRLARSGLEETRRALATLRGDVPRVDEALSELAEEHRTIGGAHCDLTIAGHAKDLPAKAGLAVIRTTQEALTNARKHAPGADVRIDLRYTEGWCELEVVDSGGNGPGALASSGGGYGLVGMRERAELIGGMLDAGPDGKGFRVLLRLPL